MSVRGLWTFLAIALPVLATLLADMSTVDLTYHLRVGDLILAGGGIPVTDSFTFTAGGMPWQDQQWGAQVILAAAWRLGGWTGLVLLRAALVAITFGAVFATVQRAGASVRPAAVVTLAAFAVGAPALALRPQLIGMALFALVLLLLGERHRRPRLAWLIPPLVILWANVHGSFFLAPLAAGFAWLDDLVGRRKDANRTLFVAVASAAAAIVTPFGPWVYAYAAGVSTNPLVTDRITEWQPSSPRSLIGLLFLGSALGVAYLLARRGAALRWPALAWLAVLFGIGAYAVRGVAWWPIGAAVAIAPLLPAALATRPAPDAGSGAPASVATPSAARRLNALIAALLVVACVLALPVWRATDPIAGPAGVLRDAPAGLTRELRSLAAPGDHVFNPQPWGSWFEFAVPGVLTFVDSRVELFPVTVWDEYAAIVGGAAGWQTILDRTGVRIVVVAAEQGAAFPARLRASGTWHEVVTDRDGSIFVRR